MINFNKLVVLIDEWHMWGYNIKSTCSYTQVLKCSKWISFSQTNWMLTLRAWKIPRQQSCLVSCLLWLTGTLMHNNWVLKSYYVQYYIVPWLLVNPLTISQFLVIITNRLEGVTAISYQELQININWIQHYPGIMRDGCA